MIVSLFAQDKLVYVVGLGRTGNSAIASLLESGAEVIAWDDSEQSRKESLRLFPGLRFTSPVQLDKNVDFILMSPGIGFKHGAFTVARERSIPILSDIDLLYLSCPKAKYIGITGTNGKSTTTALIGHIMKAAGKKVGIGGNIGIPALSLDPLASSGMYILELSSFQLDLLRHAKFDVAVFINFTPDHLDRHISMDAYFKAKCRIFREQNAHSTAVVSADYPELIALRNNLPSKVLTFSSSQDADVTITNRVLQDNINAKEIDFHGAKALPGKHNEENIAAAYLACLSAGLTSDEIGSGIWSFGGLPHRMEDIGTFSGCIFVNDSKATNAESAERALIYYDDIIWIAGGISKTGGISSLSKYFNKIKKIFLIGQAADEFEQTLKAGNCDYEKCGTIENALRTIKRSGMSGTVLLSPACASYDQYKNFEHRGEEFRKLVKEIFAGV